MRSYTLMSAGVFAIFLTSCGGAGNDMAQPFVGTNVAASLQSSVRAHPHKATAAEFLYTENYGDGNVTAYKINSKTGVLAKVKGSPFAAGMSPCCAVVVNPTGSYVYVGNDGSGSCTSGSISGYSINARTGALTQLSGSPFSGIPCPNVLGMTPNGAFLYGTNVNHYDSVSAYSVGSNGALTVLQGSPFSTCGQPQGIAIAPSGNFAYIACTLYSEFIGEIDAFTIDASSGKLTEVSGAPYSTGSLPGEMEVLPAGFNLFVTSRTNQANNYVTEYSIDTNSGALSEVAGSPFADGYETYPYDVAITPTNRFIYVTNNNSGNVAAYSISPSGGGLIPIAGSPFGAGTGPDNAAIDSTGSFLYVINNGSNNISGYRIDQRSGKLTSVAGSPFSTGRSPYGLGIASP